MQSQLLWLEFRDRFRFIFPRLPGITTHLQFCPHVTCRQLSVSASTKAFRCAHGHSGPHGDGTGASSQEGQRSARKARGPLWPRGCMADTADVPWQSLKRGACSDWDARDTKRCTSLRARSLSKSLCSAARGCDPPRSLPQRVHLPEEALLKTSVEMCLDFLAACFLLKKIEPRIKCGT